MGQQETPDVAPVTQNVSQDISKIHQVQETAILLGHN